MMSARRYVEIHIDTHRLEVGGHLLCSEILLAAAAHEEIFHLFVKLVGILEHAIKACLDVDTEESSAECAEICKLVEMWKNDVECLESSSRKS